MTHPILSLVSRREFEHLARQVQLCEISWPQCYQYGHPIQLGGDYDTENNRGMLQEARTDASADASGNDDDGETAGACTTSLELRHGGGAGASDGT